MKAAIPAMTFLPICYKDKSMSNYLIEEIYDMDLPTCYAVIRDIMTEATKDVRLKTKWIKSVLINECEQVMLSYDVIDMIDINFFDRF